MIATAVAVAISILSHPVRGPETVNLARAALASASESQSESLGPSKAIDGDPATRWSGIPGHNSGVWFELRWPKPVVVSQVVVRQYSRYSEEWDLQTWDDAHSAWVTRQHFGRKDVRLPLNVLATIAPTTTTRLRIADITNGPSFTEVEVYSNPRTFAPVVAIASDLLGNYTGIVTDSLGAQPTRTEVTMSGITSDGKWAARVSSDEHGLFTVPMRLGEKGPVTIRTANGASSTLSPASFQYGLTPLSMDLKRVDLGSGWKFACDPPVAFCEPGFDDSKWAPIKVPSHWEMQGFRAASGVGGYRKAFGLGRGSGRLMIRFDGVYSGAEVWVNGHLVATHEGGFTPFEVDVTGSVHVGRNVIAVRVREHTNVSDNLDKMSQYADFPLAGIIRKVTCYRLPETRLAHLATSTSFRGGRGSAVLAAEVDVVCDGPGRAASAPSVAGQIVDTSGHVVATSYAKLTESGPRRFSADLSFLVKHPHAWNAESPYLYTLRLQVLQAAAVRQRWVQRIGLRQTTVEGTRILINGTPVKLRGTCHHDSDPLDGRAVSVGRTRQDLRLIKEANLNSLRTSHYPPIPELVDMADEMGLYVEDEADFCWVNVADDLRNAPRILQLTAELVERDRNHPSVFMWSLCNESEFGYGFERSHEWVRSHDPSRPTSAATSAWLEIATLHNPISVKRIHENDQIDKPLLFDESLCVYQGIFNDVAEMWVDPGMRDYYAAPLQEIYRAFMKSRVTQGSQIWCWADDLFCVPGRGLEYGRGATLSHFIDGQYAMPGRGIVGDAPWGVVDGWRRKKPEFWITKKLHSPVKVAEGAIMPAPDGSFHIPVENQYDFTNLSTVKIAYALGTEKGSVAATVPPRGQGMLVVHPKHRPGPGEALGLEFLDSTGGLIDAYRLPIGGAQPHVPARHTDKLVVREGSNLAGDYVEVTSNRFSLSFDKGSGYLRRCVVDGRPLLLNLPALHVLPTDSPTQPIPLIAGWELSSFDWKSTGTGVDITLGGKYPGFEGKYVIHIDGGGHVDETSTFKFAGKEMLARECGLSFSVPRSANSLHWARSAEWSVYPGDHIGRPEGSAEAFPNVDGRVPPRHAWALDQSPMGSNDFRSTKRHLLSAWLGYPGGPGVAIDSDGLHHLRAIVETDRIVANVNDWFGGTNVGWGEWISNYGRGSVIKPGDVLTSTIHLRLVP